MQKGRYLASYQKEVVLGITNLIDRLYQGGIGENSKSPKEALRNNIVGWDRSLSYHHDNTSMFPLRTSILLLHSYLSRRFVLFMYTY